MRIIKRIDEGEFAFEALARCECCGYEQYVEGWDGDEFFEDVLPEIECLRCEKTRRDYEKEQSSVPGSV